MSGNNDYKKADFMTRLRSSEDHRIEAGWFIENVFEKHVDWTELIKNDYNYKNKFQVLIQKEFKTTPDYVELEHDIDNGYEIKVGKFPFSASGKAQASGHTDGFVKFIFDSKYGEWLGCHMIGSNVTEMISEAVVGKKLETTVHEILKSVHPHPTMSEAVMEAVADAYDEVIHI